MNRIRISSSDRHDTVEIIFRILRWHVKVNGFSIAKLWRRDEAVVLGNFLARLSSPSTLIVSQGPGQPVGERTEF